MKEYRNKELKYLVYAYIFIFLLLCTSIVDSVTMTIQQGLENVSVILECSIISGFIASCIFIFDCVISVNLKNKLVCLLFLPMKGETIFSRINNNKIKDKRFNLNEAQNKYGDIISGIPSSKGKKYEYENNHFYKIYNKYKEDKAVEQSLRDYLLCRDMFSITAVFILIYVASLILFCNIVVFSLKFIAVILFFAVITNIATHVKMDRYVNTVIAKDICNKSEDK